MADIGVALKAGWWNNNFVWLGLLVVTLLTIFLDNKVYAVLALLVLILLQVTWIANGMMMICHGLDVLVEKNQNQIP